MTIEDVIRDTIIASESEAIHGAANWKDGLLRRFAPRNDERCIFAFSRRVAPEPYLITP
jgi:hypothetical protein